MKNEKIILGSLLIIFLLGALFLYTTQKKAEETKELNNLSLGFIMKPTTYDPVKHFISHVSNVQEHFYEPLVNFKRGMEIKSVLAKNWITENDTSWVFNLRKGVKFHNGEEFTAEDAVFSVRRALGKGEVESKLTDTLSSIKSVEKLGKYKIRIRTSGPDPTLPNELTQVLIVPKNYVKENGPQILEEKPIGTGRYKVVKIKNDSTKLKAFEDYWGEKPEAENVVLKYFNQNSTAQLKALLKGEVDATSIGELKTEKVEKSEDYEVRHTTGLGIQYIAFDHREESPHVSTPKNPFRKLKVRKAAYLAINDTEIRKEVLNGYAKGATQIVPPSINGYNPEIEGIGTNIIRAKQLLNEASYSNGFNFTFSVWGTGPIDKKLGEHIKEDLKKIGINTKLEYMPLGKGIKKGMSGNVTAYQVGWVAETGDAMSPLAGIVHCTTQKYGTYNLHNYCNSEVDKLIEKAKKEMDQEVRRDKMQRAIKIAMNDIVFVPLWLGQNIYGVRKDLKWRPRAYGKLYAWEFELKE